MRTWTCANTPSCGTFFQSGIEEIAKTVPTLKRRLRPLCVCEKDRDADGVERFFCPVCSARGLSAWVRPASAEETDALIAQQNAAEAA